MMSSCEGSQKTRCSKEENNPSLGAAPEAERNQSPSTSDKKTSVL